MCYNKGGGRFGRRVTVTLASKFNNINMEYEERDIIDKAAVLQGIFCLQI